jgi:tripartite-type tricarboxylate transporter receptor subunit TctC
VVNAILSGEVQLIFVNLASISAHLESGRLRPIAITSAEPSPMRPGLPTLAASGLPGFVSVVLTAAFGPAGMGEPVVNRLNEEIVRALNLPEIRHRSTSLGIETVGSSPQDLTAAMKDEISRTTRLIKAAGIRVE